MSVVRDCVLSYRCSTLYITAPSCSTPRLHSPAHPSPQSESTPLAGVPSPAFLPSEPAQSSSYTALYAPPLSTLDTVPFNK